MLPISKGFSPSIQISNCLRIWFDILTPKQVMFFLHAIETLKRSGNDVLCTSRHYREAIELASLKKLELTTIGAHGGADRFDKLKASAQRVSELADKVHQFEPDVAISFSSPEGARVAFGLGLPHLGFNDSPHAEAVARLTVPLMTALYTPWIIPYRLWSGFGIHRSKVKHYHALDPVAWLKHEEISEREDNNMSSERKKRILVRMDETKAAYIADKRLHVDIALIDALIDRFSDLAEIVILCRYDDQIESLSARYEGTANVIRQVIEGSELIKSADVFIGGGGTMTTEAALMGKPAISIAPLPFIVESYLQKIGLARRVTSSSSLLKMVSKMLNDNAVQERQKRIARRLVAKMEDPSDRIVEAATAMASQKTR